MIPQELEQQLLSLKSAEKQRLIQLLSESLPASTPQPAHQSLVEFIQDSPLAEALASGELDLTRDQSPIPDRSPNHPLRSFPLTLPSDFDEPMTDLCS
jgi:hypothetical protein